MELLRFTTLTNDTYGRLSTSIWTTLKLDALAFGRYEAQDILFYGAYTAR